MTAKKYFTEEEAKAAARARNLAYYHRNAAKRSAARKQKYHENAEAERERARNYHAANKGKHSDWHLRKKYGITREARDQMVLDQGGRCAICGTAEAACVNGWLCVDHCHESGRIRGMLCVMCNTGIGKLGDTSESVMKAVKYLEAHERQTMVTPMSRTTLLVAA